MKNKLLTFAGALALLAVLGHFYAKPLLAQVRAALVQNVDEPGRNPIPLYQSNVNSDHADFFVPAGKRYVIEAFTGSCALDSASPLMAVEVLARPYPSGTPFGLAYAQPFPTFTGGGVTVWAASTTTRLYANPGAIITIVVSGYTINPSSCDFNVSGYAINLP